jgi:hypothetical protein
MACDYMGLHIDSRRTPHRDAAQVHNERRPPGHIVRVQRSGGDKLGLNKDLTPTQQVCNLELWPLFKEAKVTGKCAFWRISSSSSTIFKFAHLPLSKGMETRETYVWYYGTCTGVV